MKRCLLLLLWLGWLSSAIAQTPLPSFTGEPVLAVGISDDFDGLETHLQHNLSEDSPKYFVVVVSSAGDGTNATEAYAKRLHAFWSGTESEYPPTKSVLIVVGVQNRQIACLPSLALRDEGLTTEVFATQLVPQFFIPAAKHGKLEQGILELVNATERRRGHADKIALPQPVAHLPEPSRVPTLPITKTASESEKPLETKSSSSYWMFWTFGGVLFIGSVLAGLFAGVLWLIRKRMQAKATEKLEAFKNQLAELFDRVEAIKQRHELLPYADEDFSKPMEGQTLAFYEETEQQIAQYRQRWLQAVEIRQRSESLLLNEPWYSSANSRRVLEQIQVAEKGFEKTDAERVCSQRLEDLEQAHERAEALLADCKASLQNTKALLEQIDTSDLPTAPYAPEEQEIQRLLETVEEQTVADPFGASTDLKQVADRIAAWKNWMQTILSLAKRADQTAEKLNQVTELVESKRASGFRFLEQGSDPQPLLDQAQDRCEAAAHALLQGESEVATRYLDQIDALCQQVDKRIEKIEEAKSFTHTQIAMRREAVQQVRKLIETAQTDCNVLAREFARESWTELADCIPQAEQLAASWEEALSRVEALSSEQQQRYLEAANALDEVSRQQQQALQMLKSVSERLLELKRLREDCSKQAEALDRQAEQVRVLLESSSADRPRANRRFEHAQEWLRSLKDEINSTRPEWTMLHGQVAQIRREFEAVEKMGREDIQLARQAEDEIADAERALQQASGYFHLGISADLGSTRQKIDDAYQAFRRQDYEQCISQASSARRAARQAHDQARSRARQKEQRLEHERRSRQAKKRLHNSHRQHLHQQPSRWSMPALGAVASNLHSVSAVTTDSWKKPDPSPSASQNSWSEESSGPEASQNSW